MAQDFITPKFPHMLHGGDYNPDQWLDCPEILKEDIRLMKEAAVNCVSVGIFAWSRLEPEEGVYDFDWLQKVMDSLYENGIYTILATPSGAKPAWMAQKYPEIRRVSSDMIRELQGRRHNHCYTSPIYRQKVHQMDSALAQRFAKHPGVILWHLSNEFGGECFCPLCQQAFREWLKQKYKTLDALNKAWYTDFWSHRYTDWSQVEAPVPSGETAVHALNLDWKRFVTHQTVEFTQAEKDAVKAVAPEIPVTTNMMYFYGGLNYFKFKDTVDVISWDSYPEWGKNETEEEVGQHFAFMHDLMRSIKQKPFLLMESSPSATNWQDVSKLKRPGVHMLGSMQAVAHGSNSVQYFQWRKSRGSFEKFHGAVVDHYGKSDTRVFRDVSEVGKRLKGMDELYGTCNRPQVAIVYDWENMWAVQDAKGPRNCGLKYEETVLAHHKAFWKQGIGTDVIDMECDLSGYRLVIVPMLYLLRADFARKLRDFAEKGGTVVGTYWTGIVNESDLCYLNGMPGDGLMELFGLRSEEIDALYDGQYNRLVMQNFDALPQNEYKIQELCDQIICSTAETLAVYGEDFYQGKPALTLNHFGKGCAYYIAARTEDTFLCDFYTALAKNLELKPALNTVFPEGVMATRRQGTDFDAVFVMNFTPKSQQIMVHEDDVLSVNKKETRSPLSLAPYEVKILKVPHV